MPRKKKESIAPEEPLTENQEVQTVPAESGEMEGGRLPLGGRKHRAPSRGGEHPAPR